MQHFMLAGSVHGAPVRSRLLPGNHYLGRARNCEIHLDDPAVSRRHALLQVKEEGVFLRDLGSRNGTLLNERLVEGDFRVAARDIIRIGPLALTVLPEETENLAFRDDTTRARYEASTGSVRSTAPQSRRILRALFDLGRMLSRRMSLDEVYETAIDVLERSMPSRRILVLRQNPAGGEPTVAAFRLFDGSLDDPLLFSRQMIADILVKGSCLLTEDAAKDTRWDQNTNIRKIGVHAAIGAPLADEDRILGAIYMDTRKSRVVYSKEDLELLTLVANMVAAKVTHSRLEAEERRLEILQHDMDLAECIQMKLLPDTLPVIDGYDVFANVIPCEKVGGDLYDVRPLPNGEFCLVLGDVSGHGIGAALLMSHVLAGLRYLQERITDPVELVAALECRLLPNLGDGQFVTLFAAVLDPETGSLRYVNAGHWPPMVLGPGCCQQLEPTGTPLGLLRSPQERGRGKCRLDPGGAMIVVSDGVPECRQGSEFYLEAGLPRFMETWEKKVAGLSARKLGRELLEDVRRFRGHLPADDDLTLLILKRSGE